MNRFRKRKQDDNISTIKLKRFSYPECGNYSINSDLMNYEFSIPSDLRETFYESSEEKEELNEINGLISVLNEINLHPKNNDEVESHDEIFEILNKRNLNKSNVSDPICICLSSRKTLPLKGRILNSYDNLLTKIKYSSVNGRVIPERVSKPLFKNC
jgi:hypothetical protein